MLSQENYKKICSFSELRPMRPCVSDNISKASSRKFPATPIRACPMRALKKSPFFMTKTENAYDL